MQRSIHEIFRSTFTILLSILVTLAVLEVVLRIADFRVLRSGKSERSLVYRHDAELGWIPVPASSSTVTNARTIHARHNELGFRDVEFQRNGRPVLLFLGDSFVWGVDAEADERFTDLLRAKLPNYQTVNVGVSGFGTDQEYLLLQRIWPAGVAVSGRLIRLGRRCRGRRAIYRSAESQTSQLSNGQCRRFRLRHRSGISAAAANMAGRCCCFWATHSSGASMQRPTSDLPIC